MPPHVQHLLMQNQNFRKVLEQGRKLNFSGVNWPLHLGRLQELKRLAIQDTPQSKAKALALNEDFMLEMNAEMTEAVSKCAERLGWLAPGSTGEITPFPLIRTLLAELEELDALGLGLADPQLAPLRQVLWPKMKLMRARARIARLIQENELLETFVNWRLSEDGVAAARRVQATLQTLPPEALPEVEELMRSQGIDPAQRTQTFLKLLAYAEGQEEQYQRTYKNFVREWPEADPAARIASIEAQDRAGFSPWYAANAQELTELAKLFPEPPAAET